MSEVPEGMSFGPQERRPPRPTATMTMTRDGDDGIEVLLGLRSETMAAFPGYWAFPGGGLSRVDSAAVEALEGFEGLEAAQNAIKTDETKDAFAKDYKYLSKLWESLSPDNILDLYNSDYKWLSQVFQSVKPASDNIGKLLWFSLGAQTTKLIHDNVHVGDVHQLEEFVLDADVIENIFNNPDPKNAKQLEKILIKRFKKLAGDPRFKKLSDRLEALRDKAERGLITSIEFVKELCKIAKETVQAEKELEEEIQERSPKAALTELFIELKTEETPAVVERIVNDIDAIVRVISFPGWQQSSAGEREVQQALRKSLLKYKLHKDQVLFERAYAYIKEYY